MGITAFIPARGGSKGIPHKNLVNLAGRPLIEYTIDAARGSRYIDDIFISTDSRKIRDFCINLGLNVPYLRPPEYAKDDTTMVDTVLDGLGWIVANAGRMPQILVLLQPTSPLRTASDIDGAIEQFKYSDIDSLISVHKMSEHPYECIRPVAGGWEYLAMPVSNVSRRQDYKEDFYFINGAIYIVKTDFFLKRKSFIDEGRSGYYVMESSRGIDIDDLHGLRQAEFLINCKQLDK